MYLIDATLGQLADRFGTPARVLRTLSAHHERCVLDVVLADGTPVIVKGNTDRRQTEVEGTVLTAARRAGVPVPTVLASTGESASTSRSVSLLVLERLEGDWLSPDHPPSAWRAAGAALRRLHDVAVPRLPGFAGEDDWAASLRYMITHWAPRSRAGGLANEVVARVQAAVHRLVEPRPEDAAAVPVPVTLHGDCAPIHFRLDGLEVVGVLDLGDACRGDPAWDIATLTVRSPERLPAVLNGYGASEALRRWVDDALPTYRALRLLTEVGWLADHGYDPGAVVQSTTVAVDALGRSGVSHPECEE